MREVIKNDGGASQPIPTLRGLRTLAKMIGCDVRRDDEERCYRVEPMDYVAPRVGLHTVEYWGPGRGAKDQARMHLARWLMRQAGVILGAS